MRDGLIRRNVASVAVRPSQRSSPPAEGKCWSASEAQRALDAARAEGPQASALLAVALDSGARRGELQGLRWTDLDSRARHDEDLPATTPLREARARVRSAEDGTLALARPRPGDCGTAAAAQAGSGRALAHARARGSPLVFTNVDPDAKQLGGPLPAAMLRSILDRAAKRAGARRITVHGLRHTSATLLLAAGVQPHVVQRRLGHSSISTTINVYSTFSRRHNAMRPCGSVHFSTAALKQHRGTSHLSGDSQGQVQPKTLQNTGSNPPRGVLPFGSPERSRSPAQLHHFAAKPPPRDTAYTARAASPRPCLPRRGRPRLRLPLPPAPRPHAGEAEAEQRK